ncbi:hypothetical protein, partial [Mycobacterium simiae]|uniref:hypothetical protein n=1 Tax=Mycobacterium simiae TaxID=1784 RepID=UPI00358EBF70
AAVTRSPRVAAVTAGPTIAVGTRGAEQRRAFAAGPAHSSGAAATAGAAIAAVTAGPTGNRGVPAGTPLSGNGGAG